MRLRAPDTVYLKRQSARLWLSFLRPVGEAAGGFLLIRHI